MRELTNTQFFQVESGPQIQAKDILEIVYKALSETPWEDDKKALKLSSIRKDAKR